MRLAHPSAASPPHPECVVLRSRSAFASLREEWDRLVEQNAVVTPFLRWDYLDAAWGAFSEVHHPLILVVLDGGGELIGGVPLMLGRPAAGPRKHFIHLAFLGCHLCNDFETRDIVARQGREREVADLFAHALTGDLERAWDVLCLSPSPEASVSLPLLRDALSQRGLEFSAIEIPPARFIDIRGEAPVEPRSSKLRRHLNSLLRRLPEGALEVQIGGVDLPEEEVLSTLLRMHHRRWDYPEEENAHDRFHQDLAGRFGARKQLLSLLVRYEGQVAGGTYGLIHGNRYWGMVLGWLPEYRALSMGHLVIRAALERARHMGAREFDFLGGKGDYKGRWAAQEQRLERFDASNHATIRGLAFDALSGIQQKKSA